MPALMDHALKLYFRYRQKKVISMMTYPEKYQSKLLKKILGSNQGCEYGKKYDFDKIKDYSTFVQAVPLVTYEDIADDIRRMMDGSDNVLVSEAVDLYAKSSGTTSGKSKYIPVTLNYLVKGHLKCTWTAASVIYDEDPRARLFADKTLIMGGSLETLTNGKTVGDISAIMLKNFPKIGRRFATPDFDIALNPSWDEKIDYIARHCSQERVTLLGGVPTWTIVMFKEILKETGADNISEVWPDLKSYLHGGTGFEPYRELMRSYMPSQSVVFREVYNASEGYFALQNNKDEDGMLLLCNHEIFYEFMPLSEYGTSDPTIYSLQEVRKGEKYVIIITNAAGLYRYIMGDVVEFVSLSPYKIKVRGRAQQHINVFGEELMVGNTDQAIAETCQKHRCQIRDYTAAPVFMSHKSKGGHEWAAEFITPPQSEEAFATDLDKALRRINSDYDAKRYGDMALNPLKLNVLPSGTLEYWQRKHGKYGGQNKLPRLSNDRTILEDILEN